MIYRFYRIKYSIGTRRLAKDAIMPLSERRTLSGKIGMRNGGVDCIVARSVAYRLPLAR